MSTCQSIPLPDAEDHRQNYRRKLRRIGIDEDSDLYEILAGSNDAILEARAVALECMAAAGRGGAGLSPEAEAALVDRAGRAVASVAERVVRERSSSAVWRTGLLVGVVLAVGMAGAWGAGWWQGRRAGAAEAQGLSEEMQAALAAAGVDGARTWSRLIVLNDPARALARCEEKVAAGGWKGCWWWTWTAAPSAPAPAKG
jgi:hypothetical protein